MDRNTETRTTLVRTALTGVLVALAIASGACNSVEGAGEDIEDAAN